LAGIQCPEDEKGKLEDFLRELGYPFNECGDNPTYKTFLRQ
jgi:threonine dehydratase